MLVVGVVAADLGAARSAEQGGLSGAGKILLQGAHCAAGSLSAAVQAGPCAVQGVQPGQGLVISALFQGLEQLCGGVHKPVTSYSF